MQPIGACARAPGAVKPSAFGVDPASRPAAEVCPCDARAAHGSPSLPDAHSSSQDVQASDEAVVGPLLSSTGPTRPSVCMNRRPAVHRCRISRSAATLPRCVPRAAPSRVGSVRDRRVSAGALGSPAWGANQARVARGRRELPAAAPTPLLRCSPLKLVKEPIALAHAASHRSSGRAQACVNPSARRLKIQLPRMALRCPGLWLGSRAYTG